MYSKIRFLLLLFMCVSLFADEIVLPTHKIHFTGQKYFESSKLEEALGVDNKSFLEFWKKNNPRIKDKLIPGLEETIKSFYRSEGFYDATATIKETNSTVFVTIEENKPVRIRDITIESDYNISTFIRMKKDDIFRAKPFVVSKNSIISKLLDEGYCSYDLDTKAYVDVEKHSVELKYILHKGGICTFGKLTLFGLENIDDDIVISRVRALEGERFSTTLVQHTSNNLYRLGTFDSVLINVDRKIYNVIPVDIDFQEIEKPYHMEVGAGYDTYVGPRVHGQITKYNFLGNAQKLNLRASWSTLEQLLILSYFKPAFFSFYGYSIDMGARVGYSNLEFDGFKEEKGFSRVYLQHENERLKFKVGMALENIDIVALDNVSPQEELSQAVNEGTFLLYYPYVDVEYDARDSKLNPKYGYYLAGYTELGLANDKDSSVYLKAQFEGRIIHTFSDLTLSAVGKIGVIDDESGSGLPESKYFFGGGAYFNRAYGFREIGIIRSSTEDTIYGASSMLNLSLEANYPIWGDVYGGIFTDNTMLTEDAYDFKGEIISSAGLGVRYMTPIGPFKIDVGFNVRDPSIYGISFQIGQSF